MIEPAPLTPRHREQIAQADIARTAIAPGLATVLIVALLLPALTVAATQAYSGALRAAAQALPTLAALAATRRAAGLLAANQLLTSGLHRFEIGLEEMSPVLTATQPAMQSVMTRLLATGNPRVVVGREGWLFFRPDVEHLTGPPFFSDSGAARTPVAAKAPATDPRGDFSALADLQSYGVHLVVLLVPSKAAVHPEKLSPSLAGSAPLANASLPALADHLRQTGITFLDPGPMLAETAHIEGLAQYLATDTHWTPAAMDRVAAVAAAAIRPHLSPLPAAAPGIYARQPATARNTGDLARMLRLPRRGGLYPAETVGLERVVGREGEPWQPDPGAEILVLGDSFTLLYSTASMGWGTSAGFAEQLAFHLQRPVDRIAINAGGARRALTAELEAGHDRLAGKRVVLYQLAARHLTAAGETP